MESTLVQRRMQAIVVDDLFPPQAALRSERAFDSPSSPPTSKAGFKNERPTGCLKEGQARRRAFARGVVVQLCTCGGSSSCFLPCGSKVRLGGGARERLLGGGACLCVK
jgi:hypothetical protein